MNLTDCHLIYIASQDKSFNYSVYSYFRKLKFFNFEYIMWKNNEKFSTNIRIRQFKILKC